MKNIAEKDHQTVLLEIEKAVKEWYALDEHGKLVGNRLPQEVVDYLTTRPEEVKAKVWDKQFAYFLETAYDEADNARECQQLPESIQDALVTRIIRDPTSVVLFAEDLRNEFFSSRHLAKIRVNDKTHSYLMWYKFSLQDAILFWRRLEKERNNNPFSQLVPEMERYAKKYLTYQPLIPGFIGEIFKEAKGDKVEMAIISQEVSTLIDWSEDRFDGVDVKAIIDFCNTMDFLCYVRKFGLWSDQQIELIRSGQKDKIFAYIDEGGMFDDEVYAILCDYNTPEIKGREDILSYYRENSAKPIVVNL